MEVGRFLRVPRLAVHVALPNGNGSRRSHMIDVRDRLLPAVFWSYKLKFCRPAYRYHYPTYCTCRQVELQHRQLDDLLHTTFSKLQ